MRYQQWFAPFQNISLLCAKLHINAVLLGCGLGSAVLLRTALDFRDPITIWHSTIMAYFRLYFPECENRTKGSQIFPKALGQCQLKHIIWNLMECKITGCFSTERINKQLQRLILGWTSTESLNPRLVGCRLSNEISSIKHYEKNISPHKVFRARSTDHTTCKRVSRQGIFPPAMLPQLRLLLKTQNARGTEVNGRVNRKSDMRTFKNNYHL